MSNGYTPTTEEVFSWMAARGADAQGEFIRWYRDQLTVATDVGYQGAMRKAAALVRENLPGNTKAFIVSGLLDAIADDIVPGED